MPLPKATSASLSSLSSSSTSHLSILGTHPHPQIRSINHAHRLVQQPTVIPNHIMSQVKMQHGISTPETDESDQPNGLVNTDDDNSSVSKPITPQSENELSDGKSRATSPTSNASVATKNPSSWDPKDDLLLRHLKEIKKLGWKEISQYFKDRTPNACQFRWRRLKSGNLKSNTTALMDVSELPVDINEIKTDIVLNSASAPSHAAPIPPLQVESAGSSLLPSVPISSGAHGNSQSNIPYQATTTSYSVSNAKFNKSFSKPRSSSHSMPRPGFTITPSNHNLQPDEENIGLIPKIIVKSRRSSFAHFQVPLPLITSNNIPSFTANGNITPSTSSTSYLNGSTPKTRKHSISSHRLHSHHNYHPHPHPHHFNHHGSAQRRSSFNQASFIKSKFKKVFHSRGS